ncbi:divalent cation tolerance protein CutA [Planosporangium thailandense]|uniref:divalent cation tolerance protein CutA n=1 Tax=Planosporangium thailandense TaxID=765197 RepID=UPI00197B8C76
MHLRRSVLALLARATAERVDALIEHIQALHSYHVPEIISTPITAGSPAYLDWISEETRPR